MANILVVDDELGIRDLLFEILNDEGHSVDLADNAAQARAASQEARYDLVLLDIWMPDTDGVSLLKEWSLAGRLTMPVIMMSGHATIDTAVEATKIGAFSFLEKPITMQKLLRTVNLALDKKSGLKLKPSSTTLVATRPTVIGSKLGHEGEIIKSDSGNDIICATLEEKPQFLARQEFNLDLPLREAKDVFEKAYFEFHLNQEGGSMTRVAEKTGLERTHLYRKLRQIGVELNKKSSEQH